MQTYTADAQYKRACVGQIQSLFFGSWTCRTEYSISEFLWRFVCVCESALNDSQHVSYGLVRSCIKIGRAVVSRRDWPVPRLLAVGTFSVLLVVVTSSGSADPVLPDYCCDRLSSFGPYCSAARVQGKDWFFWRFDSSKLFLASSNDSKF